MRQKRGGLSLEEYRAAVRPDPEDVKRRRNEASARWRARHPDQWAEIKRRSNQRQRRRERRRQRRRAYGRKWRSLHPTYFLERRRAAGARPRVRLGGVGSELGPPWQKNDELIVQAWRLVSHVPRGEVVSFLEDELAYDAVGEAVLAMLEGSDPVAAVHRFYAGERAWARLTCRLRLDGKWECD